MLALRSLPRFSGCGTIAGASLITTLALLSVALASSGELDPSYGPSSNGISGVDVTPIKHPIGEFGSALLLLPNQKTVQGGAVYLQNGSSVFVLVQRTAEGIADSTFGTNGVVTTDIGPYFDEIHRLLRQQDGKLIALGSSYTQNSLPSGVKLVIARYRSGGPLDQSFGSAGRTLITPPPPYNVIEPTGAAILSDGRILVAGYCAISDDNEFTAIPFIARFLTDGRLDTSLGNNGILFRSFGGPSEFFTDLEIQSNGKLVASGARISSGKYQAFLARLNAGGSLDSTFGSGGISLLPVGLDSYPFDLAPGNAGSWWIAGQISVSGSPLDGLVAHFDANGHPDLTWGEDGYRQLSITPDSDKMFACAGLPDGRVTVAGGSGLPTDYTLRAFVAQFLQNGTLDAIFGNSGVTLPEGGPNSNIFAITRQYDGKILGGGQISRAADDNDLAVFRLEGNHLDRPTDFSTTVSAISPQIQLFWSDNSGFNDAYSIERDSGSGFAILATVSDVETYKDSNALQPGHLYTYRVRAKLTSSWYGAFYSEFSESVSATTPAIPSAPISPQITLAADAPRINIQWTDPNSTENRLLVLRKPGSPADPGTYITRATLGPDLTSFSDANVSPSMTYTYKVRAQNGFGFADSAAASVTTGSLPSVPANLSGVTQTNPRGVLLSWDQTGASVTQFLFYRKVGSIAGTGSYTAYGSGNGSIRTRLDNNVVSHQIYSYKIKASNVWGSSSFSKEIEIVAP
jgi:uncharacterized delta-60 repeat protein